MTTPWVAASHPCVKAPHRSHRTTHPKEPRRESPPVTEKQPVKFWTLSPQVLSTLRLLRRSNPAWSAGPYPVPFLNRRTLTVLQQRSPLCTANTGILNIIPPLQVPTSIFDPLFSNAPLANGWIQTLQLRNPVPSPLRATKAPLLESANPSPLLRKPPTLLPTVL